MYPPYRRRPDTGPASVGALTGSGALCHRADRLRTLRAADALAGAPASEGGQFLVPQILGEDA